MSNKVFISICIPAYKHIDYLKRLLDSIAIQTFKDFEVVLTDDSPGSEVEQLCLQYPNLPIRYIKNRTALGSPENWNAGIRNAKGEWIKMMHDDDWFSNKESLHHFVDAAMENSNTKFVFSGFTEVDVENGFRKEFVIDKFYLALLRRSPLTLFKKNFIGHPSTTLVKNNEEYFYDKDFKWVVDIEFYMRYLKKHKDFVAIRLPLINIGINKEQITKQVFRKQEIEIPEVFGLYKKLPTGSLKNIFCFDYFWRFIRNLSIRDENVVETFVPSIEIPVPIRNMIKEQKRFSLKTLRKGIFSKSLMIKSYILNYSKL